MTYHFGGSNMFTAIDLITRYTWTPTKVPNQSSSFPRLYGFFYIELNLWYLWYLKSKNPHNFAKTNAVVNFKNWSTPTPPNHPPLSRLVKPSLMVTSFPAINFRSRATRNATSTISRLWVQRPSPRRGLILFVWCFRCEGFRGESLESWWNFVETGIKTNWEVNN